MLYTTAMPESGNGMHPPANLPRPPGVIAPGTVVIPPNAAGTHPTHGGGNWIMEDLRAATTSVASSMGAVADGLTSAVGGVVHAASHLAQGAVDTIDAVEGGIQTTGRLLPLVVMGVLGVYVVNEVGMGSKRQRLV